MKLQATQLMTLLNVAFEAGLDNNYPALLEALDKTVSKKNVPSEEKPKNKAKKNTYSEEADEEEYAEPKAINSIKYNITAMPSVPTPASTYMPSVMEYIPTPASTYTNAVKAAFKAPTTLDNG